MFPPIKSKTQLLQYAPVQSINQAKNSPVFCNSGKSKKVIKLPFLALIAGALFFGGCQKEQITEPVLNSTSAGDLDASASGNTPPKANAGLSRVVVYPASSSATLSGSGYDAEGSVTFRWTQIGGNSNADIATPTRASTNISNLTPGLYTFVLAVTDSKGLTTKDTTYASVFQKMTWTIEGVTREALVHPPSGSNPAPIVFAFHGHGGDDASYALKQFEVSWPQAVVVYPQGLRTKSPVDKTGKQSGWQTSVGEVNSFSGVKDQDLKFFDAMVATLKNKYDVNTNYVFAHGWSNGGEFIYNVLWSARVDKIAGLSPAGATLGSATGKKPLPVIHVAGTKDDKVSFSRQQKSISTDRSIDKCSSTSTTWCTGTGGLLGKKYPSPIEAPVVSLQYDDGHRFPATVPPEVMKFFKEIAGVK